MLPPIGLLDSSTEGEMISDIGRRVTEAARKRRDWDPFVQQNRNLYETGTTHGFPADDEMIVHEIQCAVLASVVVQMREPPRPKLEPVETGEPAVYFWNGDEISAAALGIPPECVTGPAEPVTNEMGEVEADESGQPAMRVTGPPQPLPEMLGEQLFLSAVPKEQAFQQQQQRAAMEQQASAQGLAVTPTAPVVRSDWIVAMDDRLVADTYQTVFDVLWRRSRVDKWIRKNLLDTNIEGVTWGLYEFDQQTKTHVLKHLPFTQVHVDPQASGIRDANFAGFDLVYDADEALASFPTLADVIGRFQGDGNGQRHMGSPIVLGPDGYWSGEQNIDYQREIIEFRIFWLRNQPMFLSEEEAVQSGKVTQIEVPDAGEGAIEAGAAQPMVEGSGADSLHGEAVSTPATDHGDRHGTVGNGVVAGPLLPVATYLLAGTNEPVTPPTAQTWRESRWPSKLTTRQVTIIGNKVVSDIQSGFLGGRGIPILHNRNIPTAGRSPYGIGEPYRLRNVQGLMSGSLGAMLDNAKYHAHPTQFISESMAAILPADTVSRGYASPKEMLKVPDDQWLAAIQAGGITVTQPPPAMPPALSDLYAIGQQTSDRLSGNTAAIRGNLPSATASGKTVELLQDSGASVMGARAASTSDMIEDASELMLHEIVFGMEPEDICKIVSKYKPHVMEAMHLRARQIEWNVIVDVEAGTGPMKMAKRQLAQMDRQMGAISLEGYQEEAGIDSRKEKPRLKQEMEQQAQAMAGAAPQEKKDKPAA